MDQRDTWICFGLISVSNIAIMMFAFILIG
jgi:hypothetical protein